MLDDEITAFIISQMMKYNSHDDLLLSIYYVMDRHAIAFLDVYSVYN